jgi:protein SCO1/2
VGVSRLLEALGARPSYVAGRASVGHLLAIAVIGADGRIARYLTGLSHRSDALTRAIEEIASGVRVSAPPRFALLCFDYDPQTGRLTVNVMRTLMIGSGLTVAALGLGVGVSLVRERRRRG